jgi:ribosomal protein S18 acetylase RimI-like enzyme
VVKEYFENLYKEENCVIYVAKEQRQIVGYVYCRCTSSEASPEINPEALIDGIYVEEEYRNIGIATNLLNQVKKWAEENGIKFLYLNVLENNKNAMNLYKALGYTDFEKKLKLNLEK